MDVKQFEQQARQDPELGPFLREVAEDAARLVSVEEQRRFSVSGVDLLMSAAAYALFRFIKDFFDNRIMLRNTETLQKQVHCIEQLIASGVAHKDAQATIIVLFREIAKLPEDDPVLKAAKALLKRENGKRQRMRTHHEGTEDPPLFC
jgi:hypothetical protein